MWRQSEAASVYGVYEKQRRKTSNQSHGQREKQQECGPDARRVVAEEQPHGPSHLTPTGHVVYVIGAVSGVSAAPCLPHVVCRQHGIEHGRQPEGYAPRAVYVACEHLYVARHHGRQAQTYEQRGRMVGHEHGAQGHRIAVGSHLFVQALRHHAVYHATRRHHDEQQGGAWPPVVGAHQGRHGGYGGEHCHLGGYKPRLLPPPHTSHEHVAQGPHHPRHEGPCQVGEGSGVAGPEPLEHHSQQHGHSHGNAVGKAHGRQPQPVCPCYGGVWCDAVRRLVVAVRRCGVFVLVRHYSSDCPFLPNAGSTFMNVHTSMVAMQHIIVHTKK